MTEQEQDSPKLGIGGYAVLALIAVAVFCIDCFIAFGMFQGSDFPAFYEAAKQLQTPVPYPPVVALFYFPLTFFGAGTAYLCWFGVNVALLLATCLVLHHAFGVGQSGFSTFIVSLGFMPLHFLLIQGQVDAILLLSFAGCLAMFRKGNDFRAGLLLAIGLIKLQFVLPLVLYFVLRRTWRVLCGFVTGSLGVAVASVAVAGAGILTSYPRLLLDTTHRRAVDMHPEYMANIRGLWFLVSGHDAPILLLMVVGFLAIAGVAAIRTSTESSFAIAVTATLLISYHCYPHSMVLLILPLALVIRDLEWLSWRGAAVFVIASPIAALLAIRTSFALFSLAVMLLACVQLSFVAEGTRANDRRQASIGS